MNTKRLPTARAILPFVFAFLALPALAADSPAEPGLPFEVQTRYTVYVGINDKDTRLPVMPLAEAKVLLNAICLKHVGGFTVSEARGHWIDADNRPVYEDSLVYVFIGPDDRVMTPLLDEMLAAMRQSSILVEKTRPECLFYEGPPPNAQRR